MEQRLYAQVVKLCQKYFKFTTENKNTNYAKFKFQGQSARSKRWFDLDFDWIELNVSTIESSFYNKASQIHEKTQDTNTFKTSQVPIGNSKHVENSSFKMIPQCSSIFRSCRIAVVLVVYSQPLIVLKKPRPPMIYHYI